MGQYYRIVNIDKHEWMSPADFGSGLKLLEFASPIYPEMTTSALVLLLADGNNRGGGDLRSDDPIIGSWAHDRIVVVGDYADPHNGISYYQDVNDHHYRNVSVDIFKAMLEDGYIMDEVIARSVKKLENHMDYWIPEVLIRLARAKDPILNSVNPKIIDKIAEVHLWDDK